MLIGGKNPNSASQAPFLEEKQTRLALVSHLENSQGGEEGGGDPGGGCGSAKWTSVLSQFGGGLLW